MLSETIRVGGVPLNVEVAIRPEDQAKGLSGRGFLGWDHGMIFLYPTEEIRGFWMRGTELPLSIAFFDAMGMIVHIAHMHPHDENLITCPVPCRGAVEVNQGWFERNGIAPGHMVDLGKPIAVARPNQSLFEPEQTPGALPGWVSTARGVFVVTSMVAAPVAAALSYQRNRSIGWAFLSMFVGVPYLIFRFVDRGSEK